MLLTLSGSLRRASTNRLLLAEAANIYGGLVAEADIAMPLYDGDLEHAAGVPQPAQTLFDQIATADAVIIASPEYNFGMTGALKNALDWVSRIKGNPWYDKPVAIMAATAGRSGGARSTIATHVVMTHFNPRFTKGPEILVGQSHQAFDDNGRLKDARTLEFLHTAMETLREEAQGT